MSSFLNIPTHSSWSGLLTPAFRKKIEDIEACLNGSKKNVGDCEKTEDVEAYLNGLPKTVGNYAYFPEPKNVMRFLSQDLDSIKYVILGMDPYPSWYLDQNGNVTPVATGKSFEVGNLTSWQQKFSQSSLQNLVKTVYYNNTGEKKNFDEIREEISRGTFSITSPPDWFTNLEESGVMFLNATLTVDPGKPGSHTKLWGPAMDDIISYIDDKADVKWLLFGKKAQERIEYVLGNASNLYECCHPRLARFVTENIFSQAKDIEWVC